MEFGSIVKRVRKELGLSQEQLFVPVFIFTAKQPTVVINSLKEAELWDDEKANRIFVKQKTDVASEEDLFTAISEWVKKMPSVYVLKEWEAVIRRAQNSRILPPYITQIQQSCANHIVREGIMPTPEAIFGSINL